MAYQDYINCSREVLLERMAELLPEKRLTHCLGVERAAIELAQRFGVDAEKAGLAGLLQGCRLERHQGHLGPWLGPAARR